MCVCVCLYLYRYINIWDLVLIPPSSDLERQLWRSDLELPIDLLFSTIRLYSSFLNEGLVRNAGPVSSSWFLHRICDSIRNRSSNTMLRIELGSVSLCRIVIRFEVTRRMDLLHHQDRIKRRVECREDVSLFWFLLLDSLSVRVASGRGGDPQVARWRTGRFLLIWPAFLLLVDLNGKFRCRNAAELTGSRRNQCGKVEPLPKR